MMKRFRNESVRSVPPSTVADTMYRDLLSLMSIGQEKLPISRSAFTTIRK